MTCGCGAKATREVLVYRHLPQVHTASARCERCADRRASSALLDVMVVRVETRPVEVAA